MTVDDNLIASPLGKHSVFVPPYSVNNLCPIKRRVLTKREGGICVGEDIWNAYEFCFRLNNGIPCIRKLSFSVDASSDQIIESKSLKLYLNSFYNLKFNSETECLSLIKDDLESRLGIAIDLRMDAFPDCEEILIPDQYVNLDDTVSALTQGDMIVSGHNVQELLFSNSFRSLCPVTSQPDFASIIIDYKGPKLRHSSLLDYLVSFSDHKGFHEQCIEKIYMTLYELDDFEHLSVQGLFTRRGGIDINPFRSNKETKSNLYRRHSRQ